MLPCWYLHSHQSVSSMAQACPTCCDPMDCSILGFPVHHQLLEIAQTHVKSVSDSIQPSHPLDSSLLLGDPRLLNNLPRNWLCYSSNEYSGLISIGLTGLNSLLPKGLSRFYSSTTIQNHRFFGAQSYLWSNSNMTTGKTTDLIIRTFVGKVMPLLFNTLSRFVIAFLPRSKRLLISW